MNEMRSEGGSSPAVSGELRREVCGGESQPLEPIPPKSPYRKYLVLVALHMANSDDPSLLCEATDCSERTLHYVKNRLKEHDGVVFNHDRGAKRYFVMETGVLDLPKVVDWVRRLYPNRFAYIKQLGEQACGEAIATPAGQFTETA